MCQQWLLAIVCAIALSACEQADKKQASPVVPKQESPTSVAAQEPTDHPSPKVDDFKSALLHGGFLSPEGITIGEKAVFISNVGKELLPSEKDGDGRIDQFDRKGTLLETGYLPKGDALLHAPKGMIIKNNILYVADIDRIVGSDLTSRAQVFETVIEGTTFLNAIANIDNDHVLVTATNLGKVFKVNLSTGAYEDIGLTIESPNGIVFDSDRDEGYIVGYGSDGEGTGMITRFALNDDGATTETVGEITGYLDGIALYNDKLYYTDWGGFEPHIGFLYEIDPTQDTIEPAVVLNGLSGPAAFAIDTEQKKWWVPQMLSNHVVILDER